MSTKYCILCNEQQTKYKDFNLRFECLKESNSKGKEKSFQQTVPDSWVSIQNKAGLQPLYVQNNIKHYFVVPKTYIKAMTIKFIEDNLEEYRYDLEK